MILSSTEQVHQLTPNKLFELTAYPSPFLHSQKSR
jgi:hypothetical protein